MPRGEASESCCVYGSECKCERVLLARRSAQELLELMSTELPALCSKRSLALQRKAYLSEVVVEAVAVPDELEHGLLLFV
jgi:hypothetical protein